MLFVGGHHNMQDIITPQNPETNHERRTECLEIYKLYVEMADRISSRRQTANSFFLTINTAIATLVSYANLDDNYCWIISIAGVTLCCVWHRMICSYKNLNSGKFKVIHEIESKLLIAPYTAEWKTIGEGKNNKLYKPFSKVEVWVPFIFMALHMVVLIKCIGGILWRLLPCVH